MWFLKCGYPEIIQNSTISVLIPMVFAYPSFKNVYLYIYVCVYMYIYMCICIYIYVYIYMYIYMYICMYIYVYIYMYIYKCICIYICMYLSLSLLVYVQSLVDQFHSAFDPLEPGLRAHE